MLLSMTETFFVITFLSSLAFLKWKWNGLDNGGKSIKNDQYFWLEQLDGWEYHFLKIGENRQGEV